MPSKRKRNIDDAPVAKRKVGAAPRRAGAQEGDTAAAGSTAPVPAPAQPSGTQPIKAPAASGPIESSAPASADVAAAVEDGDARADSQSAQGAMTASPEDVKAGLPDEKAALRAGSEGSAPEDQDAIANDKLRSGGKATRRKSTRSERRRDRKKAKADKRARMSTPQRAFRVIRIFVIILAVLAIVAVGAAMAGVSYHRWSAYDDALDIQGTWYVSGTDTSLEITADTIVLADDVAYRYKLDPSSKTIEFSFGNLKGQGHYRFSLDRQYLVIFDGAYTWEESLSTDVAWLIQALKDRLFDNPNDLTQGAFYNVTLLSRSSADDSSMSASVVTTPEGPRVVWSAPDAETSAGDAASDANGTGDGAGGSSSSSNSSDVDSLLDNLSDHPAC